MKKTYSMKWKMIRILMACWMIPFAFLIGLLGVYVGTNHRGMTARNFQEQLEFHTKVCVERLNMAIALSREASYDGVLLDVKRQSNLESLEREKLYKEYLYSKYQKNDLISEAYFWEIGNEEQIYAVYNEGAGGSYQRIQRFQRDDQREASALAGELNTGVGFLQLRDCTYLIRNLVDNRFVEQCVLVLRLNNDYCFESIREFPMGQAAMLWIDEELVLGTEEASLKEWTPDEVKDADFYSWEKGRLYLANERNGNNFKISTRILLDRTVSQFPFYGYPYVLGVMIIGLLLLLYMMIRNFKEEVMKPVESLRTGTRLIEQGQLGYQVVDEATNEEFSYLTGAFNQMSAHLKEQFDKIYKEEIALREARIMALQSNINPHFMNNTLEIINWEARLSGNTKVSEMIGALSNMMDAAMDRRKRPEVTLKEEMGYVNSYLYITSQRLGKRLQVEIKIDEELLDYMVPRLVLQPVVENAIEHGVVPNGSGKIMLLGHRDENYLYLETINNGGLSKEDRKRVERLLNPSYVPTGESSVNLGIANVNQRLRILYGDPCGLKIEEYPKNSVIAKLTIPLQTREDNKNNQ